MSKTKICTKCKKRKKLLKFSKASKLKDGYQGWCKECSKQYYLKNKENHSKQTKKWSEEHKEELIKYRKQYNEEHKKQRKQYYEKHKKEISKNRKQYYEENKDKIKERNRKYQTANKDKIRKRQKKYNEKNKSKLNSDRKKRYDSNEDFRIRNNLRTRLNKVLHGRTKSKSTLKLLGCSVEFLKKHLKKQFTEGMNWDNHGVHGWHIDHIKPCVKFDLSKPEEQQKCFHYSNLQPLWFKDNLSKGDKY